MFFKKKKVNVPGLTILMLSCISILIVIVASGTTILLGIESKSFSLVFYGIVMGIFLTVMGISLELFGPFFRREKLFEDR